MSLEATIAENTAAIRELIAKLSTGAIIPQAAETEKPAATITGKEASGTTKKATASESGATPTVSDNSASSSTESTEASANETNETTEQNTAPAPTYEDAKAAVLKLGKVKGRQATLDVLTRFGASKLPDVLPRSFADLISVVDEVLAGGEA